MAFLLRCLIFVKSLDHSPGTMECEHRSKYNVAYLAATVLDVHHPCEWFASSQHPLLFLDFIYLLIVYLETRSRCITQETLRSTPSCCSLLSAGQHACLTVHVNAGVPEQ